MTRAILLSGGEGSRVGADIPKQYISVSGKMIIEYSLRTLLQSDYIDSLVVVASAKWQNEILSIINKYPQKAKFIGFVSPGETRQLSIYNALIFLQGIIADEDSVFIHDAARPNLSESLISEMNNAMCEHEGVLPVLPMKDTVYMVDESGSISSLLDRQHIVAGQAPEQFVYGKYFDINKKLVDDGKVMLINGSTEPAYMAGMDIITIPGDENNYKITTREDLAKFSVEMQ